MKDISDVIYNLRGDNNSILKFIEKSIKNQSFASLEEFDSFVFSWLGEFTYDSVNMSNTKNYKLYKLLLDMFNDGMYIIHDDKQRIIKYLNSPLEQKKLIYNIPFVERRGSNASSSIKSVNSMESVKSKSSSIEMAEILVSKIINTLQNGINRKDLNEKFFEKNKKLIQDFTEDNENKKIVLKILDKIY